MPTVAAALTAARNKLPANEARLLMATVLDKSIAWLVAHGESELDEDSLRRFASLVSRRHGGEPVAYLTGKREFYGRDFAVSPAVLIPRPETEMLVDLAVAHVRSRVDGGGTARVLDMGTGSGCVAISIALEFPHATVTALDQSSAALDVAAQNARTLSAAVRFVESNWFAALGDERFDVIVSNPPYVAAHDPHLEQGDLRHEPASALGSGHDGLNDIRQIIAAAGRHLLPGGTLWLEHGFDQGGVVRQLLTDASFIEVSSHKDLAGIERISGGRARINGL
jgi:release factor glutamine methyltransferase